MCINIQTSMFAFIVGIISGLILLSKSKEKKALGYFIIFYSFVQFLEANIYYNNSSIFSRLLLINLGLQGLIFFISFNQVYEIDNYYFIITGLIATFIIFKTLNNNFKDATIGNCVNWNFLDKSTITILAIMYFLMYSWMIIGRKLKKNNSNIDETFMNKAFVLYLTTLIIARLIPNKALRPGIWCLLSAITAPVLVLI